VQVVQVETHPAAVLLAKALEGALNRLIAPRRQSAGSTEAGRYGDQLHLFLTRPDLVQRQPGQLDPRQSEHRQSIRFEIKLLSMAERMLSAEERAIRQHMRSVEFRQYLNRQYTHNQKQALVNLLTLIGHGEAYAWMMAGQLAQDIRSKGGRTALSRQALEEAKHFVMMREIIRAFECPVPRLNAWEYILLEKTANASGLEKMFGLNVVVESVALSLFGLLNKLPGLELLGLFLRDEARHTALPINYFREFPLSRWEKLNPVKRMRRLLMVAPALGVLWNMEADLAEIGIDACDFGGSLLHKILKLAERAGFYGILPAGRLEELVNQLFNAYCRVTRSRHEAKDFMRPAFILHDETSDGLYCNLA